MGCKSSRSPEAEQPPRWTPDNRTADWCRSNAAPGMYAPRARQGSAHGSAPGGSAHGSGSLLGTPRSDPLGRSSHRGRGGARRGASGSQSSRSAALSVHSGLSSVGAPSYESAKGYAERSAEAQSVLKLHPDKRPIVLEIVPGADLPAVRNPKLLVPTNSDVGNLLLTVRQRMQLPDNKTLFIATKAGRTPDLRQSIAALYANSKSDDGFLYLWCSSKKFSAFWWK